MGNTETLNIDNNEITRTIAQDKEKGFRLLMAKFSEPLYWHIRRLVGNNHSGDGPGLALLVIDRHLRLGVGAEEAVFLGV